MTESDFIYLTGDVPSVLVDFNQIDTSEIFTVMIGPEYYTEQSAKDFNSTKEHWEDTVLVGECSRGCTRETYDGNYLQSQLTNHKQTKGIT